MYELIGIGETVFTLAITIVPSLIIICVIVYSDRFVEPIGTGMYSFFLGVMICFPAGILNTWLIWGHENPDNFAFLAGFTEEPLKFLAIYLFLLRKTEFNEPKAVSNTHLKLPTTPYV